MNRMTRISLLSLLLLLLSCETEPTPKTQESRAGVRRLIVLQDSQGLALPDEEIVILSKEQNANGEFLRHQLKSDGSGSFNTDSLPSGTAFLRHADDLIPLSTETGESIEGKRTILRDVGQSRFISIECQDENGRPIEAAVQLQLADGVPLHENWEQASSEGRLRLDLHWTEDPVWIEVRGPGLAARRVLVPSFAPGSLADSKPTRLRFTALLAAETFASDARTGYRLKDVRVRFRPHSSPIDEALDEGAFLLKSGNSGIIRLFLASRHPFWLQIESPGYEDLVLPEARIESLDIRLKRRP